MRKKSGLLLGFMIFTGIIFVSCAKSSGDNFLYVYGMGIEDNITSVKLYVLAEKENSEQSKRDSDKSENEKDTFQNGSTTNKVFVYEGESIESVFEEFFNTQKDIYTGTNKIYVLQTGSEDFVFDFKVYLTNSNKLPVKIPTSLTKNAYTYLIQNQEELKK